LKNLLKHCAAKGKYLVDLASTKNISPRKIKDTIAVFGVPRGGTTWLLEILSSLNDYKPIHEPININWFPMIAEIGINNRPYLDINEKNIELKEYFTKIFSGQIPSLHPISSLNRLFAKKILVKFIRANRILPWISSNFELRSIYLLLRHPCAVIASQIETGVRGYFTPKEVPLKKEMILSEALEIPILKKNNKLIEKIRTISTQEEILATIWCIEIFIPLSSPRPHPWNLVIYEKMISKWEEEIKRIFESLEENVPENVSKLFSKPSKTTHDKSNLGTQKQLYKWKEILSDNQINDILKVVAWFNLGFYGLNAEPDYEKLKNWAAF